MIQYIYFLKCPNCEDEPFDFFDEAKASALSCLGSKPIITQVEVNRNDFGECTDSRDLGTIWSWEEVMRDIPQDNNMSFSKADTFDCDNFDTEFDDNITFETDCVVNDRPLNETYYAVIEIEGKERRFPFESRDEAREYLSYVRSGKDPAFKGKQIGSMYTESCRKPIPADMTIEALVEAMEENEDTVECKWCNELFDKSEVRYEVDLGYLCPRCEAAIKSRGEELTFKEDLTETFVQNPKDLIELEYDDLEVSVFRGDREDYEEIEYTTDYTFKTSKYYVAQAIWEEFLTDEDVKELSGGSIKDMEVLNDASLWDKFFEEHFDTLFDKYYDNLLDFYRDAAREAYESDYTYSDYEIDRMEAAADAAHYDESYGSTNTSESLVEKLEESDEYKKRLTICPECGTERFDHETGICINCGFNIIA